MKLFKFYLISFLFLFSFVLVTPASAATTPTQTTTVSTNMQKSSMVADVNIKNAKITSQQGNTFNITFDLKNGTGVQTGVKYGVELLSGVKNENVVDSKVYDESITLDENSLIGRQITYIAPESLSGSYTLILNSQNSSGLPLGIAFLGKVTLSTTPQGVEIVNDSCYLKIVEDKTGTHYNVLQGVNTTKDQSLNLTCNVVNHSKSSVTMTPTYETKLRSLFGSIVQTGVGDSKAISLKPGEKTSFTLLLPKATSPNSYYIKTWLASGTNTSNTITSYYFIKGPTATIENIYLDKDSYQKNDTATLSVIWTKSSDAVVTLSSTLTDGDGNKCADAILNKSISIDPTSPINKIPFLITSNCTNPHVSVTLTDLNGNVLDQKDYAFISGGVAGSQSAKHNNTALIIIVLLVIILAIYMINKKRKGNSTGMNVVLPFLLLLAMAGFMSPIHKASAASFYSGINNEIVTTADLDSATYSPGGTITVQNLSITNNDSIPKTIDLSAINDPILNSNISILSPQTINPGSPYYIAAVKFILPNGAPTNPGTYTVSIVTGVDETPQTQEYHAISYDQQVTSEFDRSTRVGSSQCVGCSYFSASFDTSNIITNTLSGFSPTQLAMVQKYPTSQQAHSSWLAFTNPTTGGPMWELPVNWQIPAISNLWTVQNTGTYHITFSSQGSMSQHVVDRAVNATTSMLLYLKVNNQFIPFDVPNHITNNCRSSSSGNTTTIVFGTEKCASSGQSNTTVVLNYDFQLDQTFTLQAGDQVSLVFLGVAEADSNGVKQINLIFTLHPNKTEFWVKKN